MSTRIEINGDLAIISISEGYSTADIGVIFDFYNGDFIKTIRHFLFNCSEWKWVDIMGAELCILQDKSMNKQNHSVFCGLDEGIKTIITELNEGNPSPEPVFFDTLEEGLNFIGRKIS